MPKPASNGRRIYHRAPLREAAREFRMSVTSRCSVPLPKANGHFTQSEQLTAKVAQLTSQSLRGMTCARLLSTDGLHEHWLSTIIRQIGS
jgi:hypothetical protein